MRGRKRKKKLSSSCHQKVRQKERRKEVRTVVVVVVINRELVVLVLLLLQSMMMMVLLLMMLLNTQLVHTLLLCSCSRALFQTTLIPLRVLYTFMQIKCNFLSPSHSLVFFSFCSSVPVLFITLSRSAATSELRHELFKVAYELAPERKKIGEQE